MSTSRIIVTGKNKHFPKTVSMPIGWGADGVEITRSMQIRADQCKCAACWGWGEVKTWDGNPSHRATYERCTACDGDGIAQVAA